jgi:hypothetical protein
MTIFKPLPADVEVAAATPLLGEIITWTCSGISVPHLVLVTALRDAGLDESVARELAPRHAFARACRRLSDARIIRQVFESEAVIRFQFTAETRHDDRIDYELETMLELDKKSGRVSCDLPGLATLAQVELDRCIAVRSGSDVSRVLMKLYERRADLFPIRPQGGCYFVPAAHMAFTDQTQSFLGKLNGQMLRFPVPKGTNHGDTSVKVAVALGLTGLIDEHRQAIAGFGDDTRPDTLTRAAERIKQTKNKIECYAEYLADERAKLEREIAAASQQLRLRVAEIAGHKALAVA